MKYRHTAKSLFRKNIKSAKDCLSLYHGLIKISPGQANIKWLLRASVVFTVSAMDSYFHDKVKYNVGKHKLTDLPNALAKFQILISDLNKWEKAERKGNVLRTWVMDSLYYKSMHTKDGIADAIRLLGVDNFWNKVEPENMKRDSLLRTLKELVDRRNQISHEGDRHTHRSSGKRLRDIDPKSVKKWIQFVEDLVESVEKVVVDKR